MKVIDLLNKIANGEEVPVKFKVNNIEFRYEDENQLFDNLSENWIYLNDEILVPEEDKKIEKITIRAGIVGPVENKIENLNINQMAIEDKINELIDKINEE